MNNTVIAGLIVGTVALAAAAAIAVNSGFNPLQKYATVVAVEPAFETNRVAREVCGAEAAAALAAQSTAPAAAASEAEAASDAAAGEPAAAQSPSPGTDAEDADAAAGECVTVYETESIEAGYDVTYELDGVQQVVRMDHDPGERIPVEGGELVLSRS